MTEAARPGINQLAVTVTTVWANRMIGDQQLPPDADYAPNGKLLRFPDWLVKNQPRPTNRIGFSTWKHWSQGDPLVPSGLTGPVRIDAVAAQALKRQ
jgi:hypothetical protein